MIAPSPADFVSSTAALRAIGLETKGVKPPSEAEFGVKAPGKLLKLTSPPSG